MYPPNRDQSDIGLVDAPIDCSATLTDPDRTDQQFKDEADINYMLSRFGITPPRGTPTYGEWDDALDLQTAIMAVREADVAFQELPKDLRNKFTNMVELIRAVDNGSLVINDKDGPAVTPDTTTPSVKPT